ncbi:hypothetical protein H483_0109195 [Dietzia sp. UCD-THP]|nr:hypothetical protein H483_0109195 [Dietzia sp. UCD-THP]
MIPASLAISTVYSVFSLLGVGFVLGEKWVEMTPFMLAWLPFLALQVIASPLSQVLPVLGFRHQHLAVELLRLLLLAAGFALVASIPLSAAETVLVLASFMASGYLLQVLATSIIPIYGKR